MDKVLWPGPGGGCEGFAVSYMTGLDLSGDTRADGPKPEMRGPAQAPIPASFWATWVKGASSCSHPLLPLQTPQASPVPVPSAVPRLQFRVATGLMEERQASSHTGTPCTRWYR